MNAPSPRWFRWCAAAGVVSSIGLGGWAAYERGRSLPVFAAIVLAVLVATLAVAMATKILRRGDEEWVFYRQALGAILGAFAAAAALDEPKFVWLDVVTCGLASFLVFGRVGCWCAGCCYGRVQERWGVVYSAAHVDAGTPAELRGRFLAPVQLLESAVAVVLVMVSVYALSAHESPGTGTMRVTLMYATARLFLERLRGEDWRARWMGLNEAEWTSVSVLALLCLSIPHA